MEPQVFVDMDGVLADFDAHHETVFGFRPDKITDNVDWSVVRAVGDFYLNIPPMKDFHVLWDHVAPYNPIILTGIPDNVPEVAGNKTAWARKNIGDHVEVRCCRSRDKSLHADFGDILIDDWEKYMHLWIGVGGVWVTHTSALESVERLVELGVGT